MFIFTDTQKRANIYAPYTDADGVRHPRIPRELLDEIPDPFRESDETHFVTETDDPPYVINTPKPLDGIKANLWERIKQHRDDLTQTGGYRVGDKWYHSDVFSRSQQLGLVLLGANIPAGLRWKTMDGSFVDMTQALVQQIFAAAIVQDTALFATAEQHRASVEALTTVGEVAAYDWRSGWPDVYVKPPVVPEEIL